MKFKTLLVSGLLLTLGATVAGAQSRAMDGYDATDMVLGPEAGTSLIQDLDQIKQQAINNIIRRIQAGDPTVLKFIVYDVFTEVHKELVIRTRRNQAEGVQTDFYREVGDNAALAAYMGGIDNQDPKVRLRCIGFLGDWVDDIGEEMPKIAQAANDRLNSGIETREEVKYGLELLQLKVLRKIYLNRIFNGDEELLRTIDPEEFIVLVHGEEFIREIFCVPPEVVIRSIRLDPWWIQQRNVASYRVFTDLDFRTEVEEEEKNLFPNPFRGIQYLDYDPALDPDNSIYRNYPVSGNSAYGYRDRARYLDIVSLYDFRYFRYSKEGDKFPNETSLLRALFNGLANDSLFVRENCARVIVRLTDGPVGTDRGTGNDDMYEDRSSHNNPPFEIRDTTGRVVSVQGNLAELARSARYQQVAKQAWDEVKYSQYVDVHLGFEINDPGRELNYLDGVRTGRTINVPFSGGGNNAVGGTGVAMNTWGYSYNYRTDVADILRRMGLGRYVDTCDREPIRARRAGRGRYFVEDLFDPDFFNEEVRNNRIGLWHGRDEIEDEVFERF
jgi:hypothetical protein